MCIQYPHSLTHKRKKNIFLIFLKINNFTNKPGKKANAKESEVQVLDGEQEPRANCREASKECKEELIHRRKSRKRRRKRERTT